MSASRTHVQARQSSLRNQLSVATSQTPARKSFGIYYERITPLDCIMCAHLLANSLILQKQWGEGSYTHSHEFPERRPGT